MRLITSAFPHLHRPDEAGIDVGRDLVARCVRSWQDNGFDVVSIHNRAEQGVIDSLPGVEFRFIDEDLPAGARTMPTLAAVLADLPPDEPVGIINADIFMVPFAGLAGRMADAARDATLVAHRWDVPSLSRREGRRFDIGVDLIAFTPGRIAPAIQGLRRRPYQLGVPWWDYALPLAASLYAPLKLIGDTLLLHHWHALAWNEPEWHAFAAVTEAFLLEQALEPAATAELAAEFTRRLEQVAADHAGDADRHARNYALDDLARHILHQIAGGSAISLLAEMRLLPPSAADAPAWTSLSKLEQERAARRNRDGAEGAPPDRATGLAGATGSLARREGIPGGLPPREAPFPSRLAGISSDSGVGAILAAAAHDAGHLATEAGKLVERRFRLWRRGYRRRRPPPG